MEKAQSENIRNMLDEIDEHSEVQEDLFELKAEFNARLLGELFKKTIAAIDELTGGVYNKEKKEENNAKEILVTLKEVVAVIKSTFSDFANQKPPQIEFKPNVNVNLAPLESMTKTLISLVEKINLKPDNSNTDKLAALIATLVERQLAFLDREAKEQDYTEPLKSISEGVNRDDRVETLKVKRDPNSSLITEVIPVYKKI